MIFQFFSIKRHKKEKKKSGSYLLSRRSSIIGVRELDFRVRYGNGYCLSTMATGRLSLRHPPPEQGTFRAHGSFMYVFQEKKHDPSAALLATRNR